MDGLHNKKLIINFYEASIGDFICVIDNFMVLNVIFMDDMNKLSCVNKVFGELILIIPGLEYKSVEVVDANYDLGYKARYKYNIASVKSKLTFYINHDELYLLIFKLEQRKNTLRLPKSTNNYIEHKVTVLDMQYTIRSNQYLFSIVNKKNYCLVLKCMFEGNETTLYIEHPLIMSLTANYFGGVMISNQDGSLDDLLAKFLVNSLRSTMNAYKIAINILGYVFGYLPNSRDLFQIFIMDNEDKLLGCAYLNNWQWLPYKVSSGVSVVDSSQSIACPLLVGSSVVDARAVEEFAVGDIVFLDDMIDEKVDILENLYIKVGDLKIKTSLVAGSLVVSS